MILQDAVERRFLPASSSENQDVAVAAGNSNNKNITYYSDIPLGIYVIRGDSVVLLGSIHDMAVPSNMKAVTLEELGELQAKQQQDKAVAASNINKDAENGPLAWDFDTDLIA